MLETAISASVTPDVAIRATALRKIYRYHRSRPGLAGSLKDLIARQSGERVAVESLDLTIRRGEFVGLLGRNGAGKTTTLKMFSGLLRPTSGELRVQGREPQRRGFDFLRRIGIVLGNKSMLWWDVSTMENLKLHEALYDLDRRQFDETVAELGRLLEITDHLDIPVRKLSLGERMKCELMLALIHRPEVIFLDEPTIGLDVISKAAIRDFLRRLNAERQTTIILTSHDMDDIDQLCHRVLLIDHGRLQFDGSPEELITRTSPRRTVVATYAHGGRVVTEVDREAVPDFLAQLSAGGVLADLEVRGADLDEVMRQVLAGGVR
jgi:ABC-2 type transport system ATP-binding protein